MSVIPHGYLSPTNIAAREIMRRSLLTDLDARFAAAGGLADYAYTTPRNELNRMRRRVAIVLEEASALPGEADTTHAATERLLAVSSLLETEAGCRDLVEQAPLDENGKLAYHIPDEVHAVTQNNLAARLAYHGAQLADVYLHGVAFDHLQASILYRQHLAAQQFDAYTRRLAVVPCEQTQSPLGEKIHHHLTSRVLATQTDKLPGVDCEGGRASWQVPHVAESLADQSEYIKRAVDGYRQLRQDVVAATGQGLYPDDLPEHQETEWDAAARMVDVAAGHALGRGATLDAATLTRHLDVEQHGHTAGGTPARDAYLAARAQVGAVGITLADPKMRRALVLARLERGHGRIASSLPEDYDPDRKPSVWRARERSHWQRHQQTARALHANVEWQERLRTELGPNSEKITRRALALFEAREQLLARTPQLQRNAIDEELAREPEWLTETLGPRPELGAARWQALADQLAGNRLRFLVTDDADPGIRPEQSQLAHQVARFQAESHLAQSLTASVEQGI